MYTQTAQKTLLAGFAIASIGVLYFSFAAPTEARTVRSTIASSTASTTLPTPKPRVDYTCVAEAVAVREEALMTAFDLFSSTTRGALVERKANLTEAWNKETVKERTAAVKAAWKEWRATSKAIHTELRNERKEAWDTFKKTAKECKMNVPQEEALDRAKSDTIAL